MGHLGPGEAQPALALVEGEMEQWGGLLVGEEPKLNKESRDSRNEITLAGQIHIKGVAPKALRLAVVRPGS